MITRPFIFVTVLLGFSLTVQTTAAPATAPMTQGNSDDAGRLTFLGDQLTADETEIDAINKALLQQGYKVAVANDKASDAATGNDLMDRKGGAPVPWQDFYGRTAKDFIMHDPGSPVYHQVQRPSQFDYVYHANNTQIETAKSEVAAIGQKVDALLAERKKLETDQSALWATIAFESIGNRDIPLRPLYRDKLQADPAKSDDNHPEPPTVKALAAAVLYLRTAEAATSLEKQLDADQGACYTALRGAMDASFKSLQESEANFDDAAEDNPAQVKQMAGIVSSAKTIVSLSTDLAEAYAKAQDAEQAHEDERRLLFRGTVQRSLLGFSEAVGRLDDQLEQLSASWNVIPKHGTLSADKVPEIAITPASLGNAPATAAPHADSTANPTANPTAAPPAEGAAALVPADSKPDADGWVDLFDGKDLDNWKVFGNTKWAIEDGAIVGRAQPDSHAGEQLRYTPREFTNFRLRVVVNIEKGAGGIIFRAKPLPDSNSHYAVKISIPDRAKVSPGSIVSASGVLADAQEKPPITFNQWVTYEIVAQGSRLTTTVNGKTMADITDPDRSYTKGEIGLNLSLMGAVIRFKSVQIKDLGGNPAP